MFFNEPFNKLFSILGITTVLTMTFLGLEARKDLPKVPYPTALDYFVFISFTYIFSTVVQVNMLRKMRCLEFQSSFGCEEAALEVQMSVCLSVPKLNITKVMLFEVYTKPIDCTRVHKTSLLYKCVQN